jgi:hypothetical protein
MGYPLQQQQRLPKKLKFAAPPVTVPATPMEFYVSQPTMYATVAYVLAFLPFMLALLDKGSYTASDAEVEHEQDTQTEQQQPDAQPVQEVVYHPILSYIISDFEVSVIQTLCESTKELSSRELVRSLIAFWPEMGRKAVNRALYRLHDQGILCMRRDGNTPLWSVPA